MNRNFLFCLVICLILITSISCATTHDPGTSGVSEVQVVAEPQPIHGDAPVPEAEPVLAEPGMLVINEVASTGRFEFIELYNPTEFPITIGAGWGLDDNGVEYDNGARPYYIPEGVILEPYGFLLICPYSECDACKVLNNSEIPGHAIVDASFSINNRDSISLYHEDKLVDMMRWETDVNSLGKYPDGAVGSAAVGMRPTPGESNLLEPRSPEEGTVVINEVGSKGTDFIELYNAGSDMVDFGQDSWTLEDIRKEEQIPIPGDIELLAGQYLVLFPGRANPMFLLGESVYMPDAVPSISLGSSDSVILRKNGKIVSCCCWNSPVASAGRYPDGEGDWLVDLIPTIGAENKRRSE